MQYFIMILNTSDDDIIVLTTDLSQGDRHLTHFKNASLRGANAQFQYINAQISLKSKNALY